MNWEQIQAYLWTIGVPVVLILAVTLWVFRPGSRKRYEDDAHIPFEDEGETGEKTNDNNRRGDRDQETRR